MRKHKHREVNLSNITQIVRSTSRIQLRQSDSESLVSADESGKAGRTRPCSAGHSTGCPLNVIFVVI